MKAFLTGATGFVGSHVARKLVKSGVEVHILARKDSSFVRLNDVRSELTIHLGEMTDAESIARAVSAARPDRIFHFANAGVYGGISTSSERLTEVNTAGLVNLLVALRALEYEAFVNIGSSSEYGLKTSPMREDDVCEPISVYGTSKLVATRAATVEAMEYEKPIATFRLFSPYGPFDDPSRLIMQATRSLAARTPFRLPHPDAVRDYEYIDDVVDLLTCAAGNIGKHSGEVFNVGSGREVRATEVVETIARLTHTEEFLHILPPNSGSLGESESPRWVADTAKTNKAFSWSARTSLTDGLASTVAWVLAHP